MKKTLKPNYVSFRFDMSMDDPSDQPQLLIYALILAHGSLDRVLESGQLVLGNRNKARLRRHLPVHLGGTVKGIEGTAAEQELLILIANELGPNYLEELRQRLGIPARPERKG